MPILLPSLEQPVTGDQLKLDLENSFKEPNVIIDHLLYEKNVLMLVADPGVGKSILAYHLLASLSTATPLFGQLAIPEPQVAYFMQLEGAYEDAIESLKRIKKMYPVNTENIVWDSHSRVLDLMKEDHCKLMVERIKESCKPDIIFVDPLYRAVSGDLKNAEVSNSLVRFIVECQEQFGCSFILIHHTSRESYDREGHAVMKADPFYGSQFLKAYIDVAYHVKRRESGNGVILTNKKSGRLEAVINLLNLTYDEESGTVYMEDAPKKDLWDATVTYLRECRNKNKVTSFADLRKHLGCSISHLRRIQKRLEDEHCIEVFNAENGRLTHWKPL